MKKRLISLTMLVSCYIASPFCLANGGTIPIPGHPIQFFLNAGTGYSWSNKADVEANQTFWDPASQGYNADLSGSEFYSAGFGFLIDKFLSLGVNVTRRPSYKYSKFQTPPPGSAQPTGFIGTKTRKFDFANTSIMFNALIYTGALYHALIWHLTNLMSLQPFFGAGIGVAYNTVNNFHSVTAATTNGFQNVNSIGNKVTQTSLAWQALVGLHFIVTHHIAFDAGYRYFDGGNFTGPKYIYQVAGVANGLVVPAWKGHFTANEAFVHFIYTFGAFG